MPGTRDMPYHVALNSEEPEPPTTHVLAEETDRASQDWVTSSSDTEEGTGRLSGGGT